MLRAVYVSHVLVLCRLLFDVGADLQAVLITHALEALGVHILHTRSSNSM